MKNLSVRIAVYNWNPVQQTRQMFCGVFNQHRQRACTLHFHTNGTSHEEIKNSTAGPCPHSCAESFACWAVFSPSLSFSSGFSKRTEDFWNSPLTLMCFDGYSPSLSSARFEKPQPRPIIYPLGCFHVFEMFSHKCAYCAPVSQLFMLQLCRSSMSLHSF